MLRFIVRRLLGVIPVLFGLSIILFAFVHLLPGDPATATILRSRRPLAERASQRREARRARDASRLSR